MDCRAHRESRPQTFKPVGESTLAGVERTIDPVPERGDGSNVFASLIRPVPAAATGGGPGAGGEQSTSDIAQRLATLTGAQGGAAAAASTSVPATRGAEAPSGSAPGSVTGQPRVDSKDNKGVPNTGAPVDDGAARLAALARASASTAAATLEPSPSEPPSSARSVASRKKKKKKKKKEDDHAEDAAPRAVAEAAAVAPEAREVAEVLGSVLGPIADFILSPTWSGPRPGMVFRTGDSGVGYYRDDAPPTPAGASDARDGADDGDGAAHSKKAKKKKKKKDKEKGVSRVPKGTGYKKRKRKTGWGNVEQAGGDGVVTVSAFPWRRYMAEAVDTDDADAAAQRELLQREQRKKAAEEAKQKGLAAEAERRGEEGVALAGRLLALGGSAEGVESAAGSGSSPAVAEGAAGTGASTVPSDPAGGYWDSFEAGAAEDASARPAWEGPSWAALTFEVDLPAIERRKFAVGMQTIVSIESLQQNRAAVVGSRTSASVERRVTDFKWLASCLSARIPGAVLPLLPGKPRDAYSATNMELRRSRLQYWLRMFVRHPAWRHAPELALFLRAEGTTFDLERDRIDATAALKASAAKYDKRRDSSGGTGGSTHSTRGARAENALMRAPREFESAMTSMFADAAEGPFSAILGIEGGAQGDASIHAPSRSFSGRSFAAGGDLGGAASSSGSGGRSSGVADTWSGMNAPSQVVGGVRGTEAINRDTSKWSKTFKTMQSAMAAVATAADALADQEQQLSAALLNLETMSSWVHRRKVRRRRHSSGGGAVGAFIRDSVKSGGAAHAAVEGASHGKGDGLLAARGMRMRVGAAGDAANRYQGLVAAVYGSSATEQPATRARTATNETTRGRGTSVSSTQQSDADVVGALPDFATAPAHAPMTRDVTIARIDRDPLDVNYQGFSESDTDAEDQPSDDDDDEGADDGSWQPAAPGDSDRLKYVKVVFFTAESLAQLQLREQSDGKGAAVDRMLRQRESGSAISHRARFRPGDVVVKIGSSACAALPYSAVVAMLDKARSQLKEGLVSAVEVTVTHRARTKLTSADSGGGAGGGGDGGGDVAVPSQRNPLSPSNSKLKARCRSTFHSGPSAAKEGAVQMRARGVEGLAFWLAQVIPAVQRGLHPRKHPVIGTVFRRSLPADIVRRAVADITWLKHEWRADAGRAMLGFVCAAGEAAGRAAQGWESMFGHICDTRAVFEMPTLAYFDVAAARAIERRRRAGFEQKRPHRQGPQPRPVQPKSSAAKGDCKVKGSLEGSLEDAPTWKCTACGAGNPSQAIVCGGCGQRETELPWTCVTCDTNNSSSDARCTGCSRVRPSPEEAASEAAFGSSPEQASALGPAFARRGARCAGCGTRFEDAESRFCGECGRPVLAGDRGAVPLPSLANGVRHVQAAPGAGSLNVDPSQIVAEEALDAPGTSTIGPGNDGEPLGILHLLSSPVGLAGVAAENEGEADGGPADASSASLALRASGVEVEASLSPSAHSRQATMPRIASESSVSSLASLPTPTPSVGSESGTPDRAAPKPRAAPQVPTVTHPAPLTARVTRLGRDATACDVVVHDRAVSRCHALLIARRVKIRGTAGWRTIVRLIDMRSANGTELNGTRIPSGVLHGRAVVAGNVAEAELADVDTGPLLANGDLITVGDTVLQWQSREDALEAARTARARRWSGAHHPRTPSDYYGFSESDSSSSGESSDDDDDSQKGDAGGAAAPEGDESSGDDSIEV